MSTSTRRIFREKYHLETLNTWRHHNPLRYQLLHKIHHQHLFVEKTLTIQLLFQRISTSYSPLLGLPKRRVKILYYLIHMSKYCMLNISTWKYLLCKLDHMSEELSYISFINNFTSSDWQEPQKFSIYDFLMQGHESRSSNMKYQ